VVPESFRFTDGSSLLDPLADDGYVVRATQFGPLVERSWGPGDVRPAGGWELAVCTRLPARDWQELPLGRVFRDHAVVRNALSCTVEVGDATVDVTGLHTSSKLWYAGPVTHIRGLARHLDHVARPTVLAGDFNLWGPGVSRLLPRWRRAVAGRTFPAHRPHSQIDHVLVNDHIEVLAGEVLPDCGSDHRPIRVRLAVR
jgi:endonuclease/exonuclease/phosphatase (EEP) superfamily protein YafD